MWQRKSSRLLHTNLYHPYKKRFRQHFLRFDINLWPFLNSGKNNENKIYRKSRKITLLIGKIFQQRKSCFKHYGRILTHSNFINLIKYLKKQSICWYTSCLVNNYSLQNYSENNFWSVKAIFLAKWSERPEFFFYRVYQETGAEKKNSIFFSKTLFIIKILILSSEIKSRKFFFRNLPESINFNLKGCLSHKIKKNVRKFLSALVSSKITVCIQMDAACDRCTLNNYYSFLKVLQ